MSMKKQDIYKIIIDIEGNTYSGRFPHLLSTGSAIFKSVVYSDLVTFSTRPWVHYVPFKLSLSDLDELIQWAK